MEEKIFFENSKGNKLCGVLSNPTSDNKNPIIIICHGLGTNKDSEVYTRLAKILNENKISTFRFDFYGKNESEGNFEDVTLTEAIDDVENAINFLKKLDYSKIGLFGSSFGGLACIIVSSKNDEIYLLTSRSPVSNMVELFSNYSKESIESLKKNGFFYYVNSDGSKQKFNICFVEDAKKYNGYVFADKIKVPTLIVHGDDDKNVPLEQSRKLSGLIKNCVLEIVHGADHVYSKPEHLKKMMDLISKFIIDNSF